MLLEEALQSATLPPSDSCLALLSFLRDELPAGGVAAEQRFVSIFPLVMDRVFGRLTVVPVDSTIERSGAVNVKPVYHHEEGWLVSAVQNGNDPLVRLLRAPRYLALHDTSSNGNNRSYSRRDSDSSNVAPGPTLLDAISAESQRVHVDYPLDALDASLIEAWKEFIASRERSNKFPPSLKPSSYSKKAYEPRVENGRENAIKLLELLPDQPCLRPQTQRGSPLHTQSPFKSFAGSPVKSPMTPRYTTAQNSSRFTSTPGTPSSPTKEPKIHLSMIQYYLILFIRYPLLASRDAPTNRHGRSTIHRGTSVYSTLFSSYISYYLPHSGPTNGSFSDMHPTSLMFLHLIMEFWLSHNLICTTSTSLKYYASSSSSTTLSTTLRDAIDFSRVKVFKTLPSKIQHGIYTLIKHLAGDLSLGEGVKRVSGEIRERKRDEKEGRVQTQHDDGNHESNDTHAPNATGTDADSSRTWTLPLPLTTIQQSLLSYIRVGLACGNIHNKESSFYKALECWLVYIEPWNFSKRKRLHNVGGSGGHSPRELLRAATTAKQNVEYYSHYTRPKPTTKSGYTDQWEGYVVANLYFYVLPLAIFLRRAREMEFSSATEFPRSVALVQRVLRCYPSNIVNVINGALNGRADAVTNGIVARHIKQLGPYAPPEGWKLSDCSVDAMNLIEEMFDQYQNRVRSRNFLDRLEARVDSLFSGTLQREDGALYSVLEGLKCCKVLPLDYQVQSETVAEPSHGWLSRFIRTSSEVDTVGPDRDADGLLTDLGRHQLATGVKKCNPFDIHYIGDPMLAPYTSYEIPALVDLAIYTSNYLNDKLGLVPLSSLVQREEGEDVLSKNIREMKRYNQIRLRVNLRFLADYRNVLMVSFVVWLVGRLV